MVSPSRFAELEQRVDQLARRSSNRFTELHLVDPATGATRTRVGAQIDGAFTVTDSGGNPPPQPTAPTATVQPGVIRLVWDGRFANNAVIPSDLARVCVHMHPNPNFSATDETRAADLGKTATGVSITATEGDWTLALVAYNTSGIPSQMSETITVTVPPLSDLGPKIYTDDAEAAAHTGPAGSGLWYGTDSAVFVWDGTTWEPMPIGVTALAAQLVLAGRSIVVGDPLGNRVVVGEDEVDGGIGIQQVTDGVTKFLLSPSGDALFRGTLTGQSANYEEGLAGWRVEEDGSAVYQSLQVLENLTAKNLSASQIDVEGVPITDLVSAKADGLIAQGFNDSLSVQNVIGNKGIVELGFIAYPGRGYEIHIDGPVYASSDANTWVGFFMNATIDGTAPAYNSPRIANFGDREGGPDNPPTNTSWPWRTLEGSFLWYPGVTDPAGQQVRMLLVFGRVRGGGTVGINCSQYRCQIWVTDAGPALPNSMRVNGSTASAPPPPPPPPVQYYEETHYSIWTASFRQNGSRWAENDRLYQGYGDSFNGNQGSMIGFDYNYIRSRVSAGALKWARLSIRNWHTWFYSGGTAFIGEHNNGGMPGTWGGIVVERGASVGTAKGGWIDVDVTPAVANILSGVSTGLILGRAPTNDSAYYGYWYGQNYADKPRMTIGWES